MDNLVVVDICLLSLIRLLLNLSHSNRHLWFLRYFNLIVLFWHLTLLRYHMFSFFTSLAIDLCYHFGFQSFAVNNFPIADILDKLYSLVTLLFLPIIFRIRYLLSKFFGICLIDVVIMFSYKAFIRNLPLLH